LTSLTSSWPYYRWFLCVIMLHHIDVTDLILTILSLISMCNNVTSYWRRWPHLDHIIVDFCVIMLHHIDVADLILTILSLISMCNNVTSYWRHWPHLDKSSINILSFICFARNIALRNPFSQNKSTIVYIY
jgi:hypothetical protein